MFRSKLTDEIHLKAIDIAERCAASALAIAGMGAICADANATQLDAVPTATSIEAVMAPEIQASEGALLLDIVQRDPLTGEMVANHYSHASHGSHSSHYSSRP